MKVTNYIQIDFSNNKDITVPSIQLDSGTRWVKLKLCNNGIPMTLDGIRVYVMAIKSDGKEVFNDCVILDAENGLIEFEITEQMGALKGKVECQIKLMEQDRLLSSNIFTLFINKSLTLENSESTNELNTLVKALNRVENLDEELVREFTNTFNNSQTERSELFVEKMNEFESRFLEIKGEKGDKGDVGPQGPQGEKGDKGEIMPSDMVDYMGNQHESLKAKNDADVDWLLGEINTVHYDGQHITATDSIEGRSKSAILTGQTLVNLVPNKGENTIVGTGSRIVRYELPYILPKNKKYLLCCNVKTITTTPSETGEITFALYSDNGDTNQYILSTTSSGYLKKIFTTSDKDYSTQKLWVFARHGETTSATFDNVMMIEYQDGMENWDIPYFEGMQSVKMPVLTTTGKNLFDESEKVEGFIPNNHLKEELQTGVKNTWTTPWIKAKTNTSYTIQGGNRNNWQIKSRNNVITFMNTKTITTLSDTEYIRCYYCNETFIASNVQLEEGSTATSYEPYKSNILSTNEDVTLRGVGDVQDTLDCLTGEVVSNVGEIVYDGSDDENWSTAYIEVDGLTGIATNIPDNMEYLGANRIDGFINNRLKQAVNEDMSMYSGYGGWRMFAIYMNSSTFDTVQKIKDWLSQNPITVQYQLAEKSIKTVALSDNHVYSYKDVTHYDCSSAEGSLVPTLSIDVPTNLPAVVTRQKTMIHELEVENKALTDELQRVEEKGDQADLEQLSTTWEIDYRVSELEWFIEDNMSPTMSVAKTMNLKLGGNTMALSRFEQAKIMILGGAYNRETLERQLKRYYEKGDLTKDEYETLIALMDAKELVTEN